MKCVGVTPDIHDENISKDFAYLLDRFEQKHEIRACLDYFPKGTADIVWMREIASWGGDGTVVAICGDGRILTNEVERQVLKESELMFVYLAPGWTNITWHEQAWKIIKVWPDIVENIERARYPMVFEVSVQLKLRVIGRTSRL